MPARSSLPSSAHCASRGKSSVRQMVAAVGDEDRAALREQARQLDLGLLARPAKPDQTSVPPPRSRLERRARTSRGARRRRRRSRPVPRRRASRRSAAPAPACARRGRSRGSRRHRRAARPARPRARRRRSRSPRRARLRGTRAVSSTDMTPVATAQPIRHACSTGSSSGTRDRGGRGNDGARRERAGAQHRRQRRPVAPVQASVRRAVGCLHRRGCPRAHSAHSPHAVCQPSTTRSPTATSSTLGADGVDRPGALVSEQHGKRVPPAVLLDDVQVACGRRRSPRCGRRPRRAPARRRRSARARPRPARSGRRRDPRRVERRRSSARP